MDESSKTRRQESVVQRLEALAIQVRSSLPPYIDARTRPDRDCDVIPTGCPQPVEMDETWLVAVKSDQLKRNLIDHPCGDYRTITAGDVELFEYDERRITLHASKRRDPDIGVLRRREILMQSKALKRGATVVPPVVRSVCIKHH